MGRELNCCKYNVSEALRAFIKYKATWWKFHLWLRHFSSRRHFEVCSFNIPALPCVLQKSDIYRRLVLDVRWSGGSWMCISSSVQRLPVAVTAAAALLLVLLFRIPPVAWICLLWVLCISSQRSLRPADHSSRGHLQSVVCLSVIVKPR